MNIPWISIWQLFQYRLEPCDFWIKTIAFLILQVVYSPSVPAGEQATDAPPPSYAPSDSASQGQIPAKI